jgi:hypothetical protein
MWLFAKRNLNVSQFMLSILLALLHHNLANQELGKLAVFHSILLTPLSFCGMFSSFATVLIMTQPWVFWRSEFILIAIPKDRQVASNYDVADLFLDSQVDGGLKA